MPVRKQPQPHVTDASAVPYRSTACRIGTHPACAELSPTTTPDAVPVIYETCGCPCHSTPDRSTPAKELR
ncbi:hypothetical protein [Streptomyces sp. NPDC001315]|uniref:hypothetical protein n=1 Tax=Streptomyces sp. NPDC001315 TaxID=3364562 RepID=UPI00367E4C3D